MVGRIKIGRIGMERIRMERIRIGGIRMERVRVGKIRIIRIRMERIRIGRIEMEGLGFGRVRIEIIRIRRIRIDSCLKIWSSGSELVLNLNWTWWTSSCRFSSGLGQSSRFRFRFSSRGPQTELNWTLATLVMETWRDVNKMEEYVHFM